MPLKNHGKGTASTVGGMRPKVRSREIPCREMAAADTGSSGEINLENRLKPSRPRRDPTGIRDTRPEAQNVAGETPKRQWTASISSGLALQRHIPVSGNSETPQKHPIKGKVKPGGGSGAEIPRENYRKEKKGPSRPLCHPPIVQGARAIPEMLAARGKKQSKGNASLLRDSSLYTRELPTKAHHCTGPSLYTGHGNISAQDGQEYAAHNEDLLEDMIQNVEEANYAIQQLNELGLGEDISYEELEGYLERLPCKLHHVDTSVEPDGEQLNELQVRNILYRIKYCKFKYQRRQNDETFLDANLDDNHPLYHLKEKLECLEDDATKMEGDHLLEYLENKGLLRHIENDGIFGWSFHYGAVVGSDDYQRIVPQNYGGYEYENWNTYRRYFHCYEVELEYLLYWEELLKKLKWMEDYVAIKRPSLKWGKICTRGCYQAIKIATRYSKITEGLARAAYYDCISTMCLDICRCKELDVIYLAIWQRVTMQKESFRDALHEVYKSHKFLQCHKKMKDAVENDNWSEMEKEFHIWTSGISGKITEDKALELITDAIKNQRGRPKFYAQYIKKKMEIARAIGVITKPQDIPLQN